MGGQQGTRGDVTASRTVAGVVERRWWLYVGVVAPRRSNCIEEDLSPRWSLKVGRRKGGRYGNVTGAYVDGRSMGSIVVKFGEVWWSMVGSAENGGK